MVGVSSVLYDVVGQLAYYIITHPNPKAIIHAIKILNPKPNPNPQLIYTSKCIMSCYANYKYIMCQ